MGFYFKNAGIPAASALSIGILYAFRVGELLHSTGRMYAEDPCDSTFTGVLRNKGSEPAAAKIWPNACHFERRASSVSFTLLK